MATKTTSSDIPGQTTTLPPGRWLTGCAVAKNH